MTKIIAGLMLALALVLGLLAGASAQGEQPVISAATLRLLPEYDDPGLLVVLAGDFSDSTPLPVQLAIPVTPDARGIQATVNDPDRGLLTQQWELVDGKLTYTVPLPGFHAEWYVDRPPSGDQREIRYSFAAPFDIEQLELAVQQPERATGFSLAPAPEGTFVGADGLTYHTLKRAGLKAGDTFDITIRYVKTDDGLSAPKSEVPPAEPIVTAPAPSSGLPDRWLPWALIAAGLLALGAAGLYWLLQGRLRPAAGAAVTKNAASPDERIPDPGGRGVSFCTQCGRLFAASDRFCANCGAPRRE